MSNTPLTIFRKLYRAALVATWAIILFHISGFAQSRVRVTALINGTIIDRNGGPPLKQLTILIRNNRIADVGSNVEVPKGANVIDLDGKTVIPGLIDMHGHLYARTSTEPGIMSNQFDSYPQLYLAGGVTTIRSPGDFDPKGTITVRKRILNNEVIGPRIFTAGPYFDNAPSQISWIKGVKTTKEALNLLNKWKSRIDLVKIYTSITKPELRALPDEPDNEKITVSGH